MSLFYLVAALIHTPAVAPTPNATVATAPAEANADDMRITSAYSLVNKGKSAEALEIAEQVIAAKESAHPPRDDVIFFSSRSMVEDLLYTTASTKLKKQVIVLDSNWAEAYFLKGFALIDLNRGDEALLWLDKAVVLAPMNAHFLAERAEWYKSHRKWKEALSEFQRARSAADFSPDDVKVAEEGRAIRGIAFVKVEQGKFDEAEKLLNEALRLNPADQRARADLTELPSLRR